MNLITAENSWLIIIPDIDSLRSNISSFANLLNEGENISFIYNITKIGSKCYVSLLPIFYKIKSYKNILIYLHNIIIFTMYIFLNIFFKIILL